MPPWDVVKPLSVTRASGGQVVPQADDSVLIPTSAEKDTYSINLSVSPANAAAALTEISAIQLETLPDESLPNQGSGHGGGNFVITQVKAEWVPDDVRSRPVRFVRISIPGQQKILSLAEVQVFVGGENVAGQGLATQSSVDFCGFAGISHRWQLKRNICGQVGNPYGDFRRALVGNRFAELARRRKNRDLEPDR